MEKQPSRRIVKYGACPHCEGYLAVVDKDWFTLYVCSECHWSRVISHEMPNDLFVMLNNNKYAEVVTRVEARVAALVTQRHEYPIWPLHEGEMDEFEKSYHGAIRGPYYVSTIFMIQTLRALRNIS